MQKDSGACDITALMWVMKIGSEANDLSHFVAAQLEMLHFPSKLAMTMKLTSKHQVELWFHIKYKCISSWPFKTETLLSFLVGRQIAY